MSFSSRSLLSTSSEVLGGGGGGNSNLSLTSTDTRTRHETAIHTLDLDVGLVGRERERLVLEQAYDRVCCRVQRAPSELVLVEGMSGAGKSTLVSSLLESINREDMGLFVRGKYDLHSSAPYEAIVEAATELCHAVSVSEYYLGDVKEHLQSVLSSDNDRRLLLNMVPAANVLLEAKAGVVETLAEKRSSHAFALKHLMEVLNIFWNAVASVHPVVLFLDDLQWADASAKELLTSLVTDMSSANLLVVGAFREGGFVWDMDNSKNRKWRMSKITLGPLTQTSVNEILSIATKRRPEETKCLGEAVYGKTNGNALFLMEFLDMLQSSGLMFFSFQTNQWEWEADITARTDVSDNVAELLMNKLGRLSTQTQMVLMLAACLGHSFDSGVLQTILLSSDDLRSRVICDSDAPLNPESEKQHFQTALRDAVKMGLIERVSENRLKFSHDAIQQAAFSMRPSGMDEDVFHSGLGERILCLSRTESGEDWMLFSAVNLLTRSSSTIEASELPREELARLCLEVSRKALSKAAFVTAASYADRGYSLLHSPDCWESQYALSLDLRTLSSELHYSYGDHDGAVGAASDVIAQARTPREKHSAHIVVISARVMQKNLPEAIRLCLLMLREYRIGFPAKVTKFHVLVNSLKVRKLLNGRQASDLLQLPRAKDGNMTRSCQVLYILTNTAWLSGQQELSQLACLLMMRLTLTNGISAYSACSFAVYGAFLSHFGKLDAAYEYGRLALEMEKVFGNNVTMARTYVSVYSFLIHLRDPIRVSLEPLKLAYETGMQVGDVNYAGRCLVWRVILCFHSGMRLDHLEIQTREYCELFRRYNLEAALCNTQPVFQLVLNLLGKSKNPLLMSGEAIGNETEFAEQQRRAGSSSSLVLLQNTRMILLVLLDELELADTERRKRPSEISGIYHPKCCNILFSALTCLGLAKQRKREGRALKSLGYRIKARKYRNRLNKLVRNGLVNCVPFVKLLDAETSSFRPDLHEQSMNLYQNAIAASGRCGFRLCKGLAYEKAGQYLLERGDQARATNYLQCAWNEFSDLCARAKLTQMNLKYGDLISLENIDDAFASSRPSSLTKPHSVRSVFSSQN